MLTLYTKNHCAFCVQAKGLLKNNNIPFTEVNIETDADALKFLQAEGHKTMPQIYCDGALFVAGGFQGLRDMGVDAIRAQLGITSINVNELGDL